MSSRLATLLVLLSGALFFCLPARAATVCVSDVAGLKSALASLDLQPDGSTLTIKLKQGTYAVGNQLAHMYGANAIGVVSLKLLGGYTSNCASRSPNPANTVLDGQGTAASGIGFLMKGDSNALIEGVTFTRFKGKSNQPWAESEVLLIQRDNDGSDSQAFEVRQCRFTHNSGQNVVRMSGAQMRFVNNLVSDSTLAPDGSGGVDMGAFTVTLDADIDGTVTATNNTIVRTTGGPAMRLGTLTTGSSGRISEVTDNILWDNQSWDIVFTGTAQHVYPLMASFNLYNSASNVPQNPGDLHVDPRFVDAANENFRLASNSPAINKGAPLQMMGFPARDLDGNARIVGSRIDLGAYESSIDDTTTAVVTTTSDNGNNTSPLAGSLRAAIKSANAASGPFRIIFNVPGGCPRLLSLAAPMLDITGDVTVDGTTQPGWTPNDQYGQFNANLCFAVNGAGNANTPWALHVPASAPNSARLVVRGIAFAGFNDAAIKLEGGRNHRIAGNLFGPIPFTPANNNAIRVTGASGGAFIGGYDDPSALNLVAVAAGAGIYLDNTSGGSTVANNVIGFQADGISSGGNASGVFAFNSPNNVIQYNAIGNNASYGVTLSGSGSSGNLVQYNTIGIDIDGGSAGNASGGVLVSFAAKNNTIGAPLGATWGGNFIYNSGGPGVWISPSGGAGNRVLDNGFSANAGLDIDLAQAGPSANQPSNPATGPNNLQNYPVLATAVRDVASDTETVTGTLISTPDTTFRLDLYWGAGCLASGRVNALYPLMKTYVTTGALGSVPFTATVAFGWHLPLGGIGATVTDPAGNTSEIGNCVAETLSDRIFKNGFE